MVLVALVMARRNQDVSDTDDALLRLVYQTLRYILDVH